MHKRSVPAPLRLLRAPPSRSAVKLPHARLVLHLLLASPPPSPSPPPPFCSLQRRVREATEGGGVHNFTCRPCQNGQGEGRQAVPRGVPHGAVTPLRPGNLQTGGAGRSPGGGVFCPRRAVVRLVLHLLLWPWWQARLAPWSAVVAVCTLPDEWCITVARAAAIDSCSCRQPRAQSSLPATAEQLPSRASPARHQP